jgi:hypothetical protein
MPLGDVTYVNAALDAIVDSWPATLATYRLYASDPTLATLPGDVELTSDGGYAPVGFDPADWAAAVDGAKSPTAAVSFGTSSAAYSDVGTYWGIVDDAGLLVFSDDLPDAEVVEVDDAGTTVAFTPTLSFADGE